jgi:hypothetical protein
MRETTMTKDETVEKFAPGTWVRVVGEIPGRPGLGANKEHPIGVVRQVQRTGPTEYGALVYFGQGHFGFGQYERHLELWVPQVGELVRGEGGTCIVNRVEDDEGAPGRRLQIWGVWGAQKREAYMWLHECRPVLDANGRPLRDTPAAAASSPTVETPVAAVSPPATKGQLIYNDTCAKCGAPAYVGLFSVECSVGPPACGAPEEPGTVEETFYTLIQPAKDDKDGKARRETCRADAPGAERFFVASGRGTRVQALTREGAIAAWHLRRAEERKYPLRIAT